MEKAQVLGKGSFGTTYLAAFRGSQAAVKCVRMAGDAAGRNFVREVSALARVSHPHIVQLLGTFPSPFPSCSTCSSLGQVETD